MDEDVILGLLQRSDARCQCLAYCRKVISTNVSQPEKMVKPQDDVGLGLGSSYEDLWQKVYLCLGSRQAREYTVSSAPRRSELSADHKAYLQKLSDDFVLDTKELITQNLTKIESGTSTKQLLREVLHHAMLAKEHLDGEWNTGRYSELFRRLQSYIKDPRQSCHPFMIYGPEGSDRLRAMSAVAAAISDWLSNSGPVLVLRFFGTTADSLDVQTCVASVRAQIQMLSGIEVSPPCDSLHSELTAFRGVLEEVSRTSAHHSGPLFILLDGLEELQPHRDALEALWTVRNLPANIYIIMSVTSSGCQKTGSVDILKALLSLIGNPDLTYNVGFSGDIDSTQPDDYRHSSVGLISRRLAPPVEVIISTLDKMEADYGPTLVKYFAAYVTVANVGILDLEMFDLLATNDEVMAERDRVLFTPGIVSILRHRLIDFLASRLVCGCVGFSWSRPDYRQAVAKRYRLTVGGVRQEAWLNEEMNNFSVTLHRHFVQIYQEVTRKRSTLEDEISFEEDFDKVDDVRVGLQTLGPQNPIKASRLLHHLSVLLPVDGVDHVKSCVLFNLDWLFSRLATSPIFEVINDVLSVYNLGQDMRQRAITTDSFKDVGILLEFLQLSSKALSINHLSLPSEVVTRLGPFVHKYPSVVGLVSECRRWLADTESPVLVPLWSVWDRPGGTRRHTLDGVLHVVGAVDGGKAVVGYNQCRVSIWCVQTGLLLQNFKVKSEQPVSGIVAAHHGAFIMTSCYSQVAGMTELTVLSTETGLSLLSLNLPHQFEAVALSKDDRLFVMSSVNRAADTDRECGRSIIGIDIISRDVVFQLPVVDIHTEGINNHTFGHIYLCCCCCCCCCCDCPSSRAASRSSSI